MEYLVNKKINPSKLLDEIRNSDITISVKSAVANTDAVTGEETGLITFRAALTESDKIIFDSIVAAHDIHEEGDSPIVITSVVENEKFSSLGVELSYRLKPFVFDIPAGQGEHEFVVSFPYTIMLLGGTVDIHEAMLGDSMRFCSLAPTAIGQLPVTVASGSNEIIIAKQQGAYCFKGLDIFIENDYVGRIINIIRESTVDRLILSDSATKDFAAGNVIYIAYTTVEKYLITTAPMVLWVSRDTDRGAIINANQQMRFTYWNDSGVAKKVQFSIEYYS